MMRFMSSTPANVTGLIAGIATLIYVLGTAPALLGIGVLLICLCLNRVFGKLSSFVADRELQAADARLMASGNDG